MAGKYLEIGDVVKDSPIGPGTITDITDAGYPQVNHIAVAWLEREDGVVFDPHGVREKTQSRQFGGCPECGSRTCVARPCSRTVSHNAQTIPGVQWQCGPQASGFTPEADNQPAQVLDYPPLPKPDCPNIWGGAYSKKQMRAYVDADRAARTPPAQAVETPGGDTYAEYKAWADAASQCDKEPHTELRKSWAPGQRWQTRIPAYTEWFELTAPPAWFWYAEYRRHPEDVSTTSQADSGAVPVDVPVNRIPLLDERYQECALVRTARGWEFHRNGNPIRELNIYERLFVDSALAAHTPPTSLWHTNKS